MGADGENAHVTYLLDSGSAEDKRDGSPLCKPEHNSSIAPDSTTSVSLPMTKPGESWVEATRVWVTSPREHPFNVEWLRFEPDTPVTGPLRTEPHVAYRVDDVQAALQGLDVLAEPFDVGDGFLTVAFAVVDGAVVEFMQYANPDEEGWF